MYNSNTKAAAYDSPSMPVFYTITVAAAQNSFNGPTALAYNYRLDLLYVMDQIAVRYIDMKTKNAYTLHSDREDHPVKMGISPSTQRGLMVCYCTLT